MPSTSNSTVRNGASGRSRNKGLYSCATLFLLLSLAFQLAGVIAPGWMIVEVEGGSGSVHAGLFRAEQCTQDKCETMSVKKIFDIMEKSGSAVAMGDLNEYRTETILAVITCFVALTITVRMEHCGRGLSNKARKVYLIIVTLALALSGALAMAAAGKWGTNLMDDKEKFDITGVFEYKPPYALILTGIGGLLAGLIFVIMTFKAFNERDQDQPASTGPTAVLQAGQPYIVPPPQASVHASTSFTLNSPVSSNIYPSAPPIEEYYMHAPPPSYSDLHTTNMGYNPYTGNQPYTGSQSYTGSQQNAGSQQYTGNLANNNLYNSNNNLYNPNSGYNRSLDNPNR